MEGGREGGREERVVGRKKPVSTHALSGAGKERKGRSE